MVVPPNNPTHWRGSLGVGIDRARDRILKITFLTRLSSKSAFRRMKYTGQQKQAQLRRASSLNLRRHWNVNFSWWTPAQHRRLNNRGGITVFLQQTKILHTYGYALYLFFLFETGPNRPEPVPCVMGVIPRQPNKQWSASCDGFGVLGNPIHAIRYAFWAHTKDTVFLFFTILLPHLIILLQFCSHFFLWNNHANHCPRNKTSRQRSGERACARAFALWRALGSSSSSSFTGFRWICLTETGLSQVIPV